MVMIRLYGWQIVWKGKIGREKGEKKGGRDKAA